VLRCHPALLPVRVRGEAYSSWQAGGMRGRGVATSL